ncbi:Tetratricopeptide repeat-containing protein [Nitrosospira briensis]|uniref:Tetratricopeptide repeat-containing protein n=2 Tax=Nitrosospira briensis TaxID=35799 RepID=A0A1I5EEK1_9PROT|nr:Tetratricopeptide repeat-containing protein [Nitrosospira briensis]
MLTLYPVMLGAFLSALHAPFAAAETPEQILAEASPFVVSVDMVDANGKLLGQGSGVVMGTGRVITTCDVARKGKNGQVRRAGTAFKAVLQYVQADNLCHLNVPHLQSPPIARGTAKKLRIDQRVYAVGAPGKKQGQKEQRGGKPILSKGHISRLRPYRGSQYILSSAAISSAFSGGGLFDSDGELIGILSPQRVEGENLAFVLPVDWIEEPPHETKGPKGANEPQQVRAGSARKNNNGLDWLNRSLALEKKADWRALLKLSQQEVKRDPSNAVAWFSAGVAFTNLKQYNEAVDAYREAIRNQAEYGAAWHNLGVAYANLKDYDDAIQSYEDALRIQPDNAEVWYDLGNTYRERKQYPYAIHAYRQSLGINPENSRAWYNLGITYDDLKLYDESAEAYQETVRIQPENADAWYNLGLAYAMLEERGKMRDIYQALRKLDPARAELYFNTYILP